MRNYKKALNTYLIGFIIIFAISGTAFAQSIAEIKDMSNQVSRKKQKTDMVPLAKALKSIERSRHISILYQTPLIKGEKVPQVWLRSDSLAVKIGKFLTVQGLIYQQDSRGVYVIKRLSVLNDGALANARPQQLQETITGTVTDRSTGNTLPGVNIRVKGTSTGTATDADGQYELTIESLQDTLVFSFVGYQTQNVPIQGRTTIDVEMQPQALQGKEMVVIGYGTQQEENVIGSVANIKSEQISKAPVDNASTALEGRVPGVTIQQGSGEPGRNAASILIRGNSTLGNNDPLIVVDGVPGRDLNSIDPQNIEDISILKDASAAVYGARAANGVVLVTTKKGQKETPAKFHYGFRQGFLNPTKVPEMADAGTYAQMIRETERYRGTDESNMTYSKEDIEKYKSGEYPWTYPNTDWFEETLADYSTSRKHDLSISGGTESITYYGSFGKTFTDGIYENSATSYNRYNEELHLNVDANKYLNIGIDISGSQENRKYSSQSSGDIFGTIMRMYPTSVAVFPNGKPGPDIEYGYNPVVMPSNKTGFDDDKRFRINSKFSAEFKIPGVDGLSLSSYFAYDRYFQKRKLLQKPWTLYSLNKNAYIAAGNTGSEDPSDFLSSVSKGYSEPRLTDFSQNNHTTHFNFRVNYEKTFNDAHNFSAFVAYESSEVKHNGFQAFRRYFKTDALPYLFAGGDDQKDNDENVMIDARASYIGRLSYNYLETYLLQFSFRRDGSLRFSKEAGRWGNFPSLLAGWRISNEEFWKENIRFINFLKLKASWGKLGNDLVEPFQYLRTYSFGQGGVFGENKTYYYGLYQTYTPNPLITWEVANMYNVGFESSLFDSKINLDATFSYQRRNDILVERNASVPSFSGVSLPDENYGIVDSKGVEVSLGYNSQNKTDFFYEINGNFSFYRDKVIEFDEPKRSVPWQRRTGHPQGSELLYHAIGVFKDEKQVNSMPHVEAARPGDIIIEDYDGDGEITSDDQILFDKTPTPEITFGLNFNLEYKNWALSGLIQGKGNSMRRTYQDDRQGSGGNYFQYDADGRWTPDNKDATKPRAFERLEEYWRDSRLTDYSFTNTAYARVKNMQISYTIPQGIQKKIGLRNAQIYLTGHNLFFIYNKSKIMDPELGADSNYPLMRTISVGATIDF